MIFRMKYSLLLCLCIIAGYNGYANAIDSLSTKEDIQKFLVASLGKNGIILPDKCEGIFVHDTGIRYTDTGTYDYPFDEVVKMMDDAPWHIYKEDIDCNGRTDMVIDAGIVLIVMDMGDHFEGHIFAGMPSWYFPTWNTYSFKNFIFLPDGTRALLLRHDHNPCRSVQHAVLKGNLSYVTNTVAGNTENTAPLKIDTLYKVTIGNDTAWRPTYSTDSVRFTVYSFADTVDMRLYNMTDTIVYKFNGFTNYKPCFKPGGISKIDYCYINIPHAMSTISTSACLEINKNGICFFQYLEEYNRCSSAILDSVRVQNLFNFISYIDMKSVQDLYWCESLEGGVGGIFTIFFDDGTVKKISVWSHRLPMALGYLSKSLADISWALNWQPSDKPQDFKCSCKMPPDSSLDQAEFENNLHSCKCY